MSSYRIAGIIAGLVAIFGSGSVIAADKPAPRKPNIVFVIADDLGYGDLGCYGQKKIPTPNLDRLAAEGMRLTRHYSGNAVCAPSRCVLMTGKHPGHAFIRDNREVKPEGQFPIPADTVTIPKLLQQAGYVTGAFGKWGLGAPGSEGEPLKQGFNRFFGYNCQRVAHNYYPTHLWDDAQKIALKNQAFPSQDKLKPSEDPKNPESYARFRGSDYAPDLIAQQAIRFVETNRDKPFFLFVPTTVPHLALQVPADEVVPFADKFGDIPYPGGRGYTPTFAPRATYAAMIHRMDREIGRIMDQVKSLGLDEDTLFVFTSDNGPLYDQLGGTDSEFFNSHGGLRGRKGSLYEGGVRVPCIVRWPGKIAAGTVSDRVTGFEDWLPTLLELIGGSTAPKSLDGISFAPTLLGKPQPERPFLYREFSGYGGQQSVRVGDWKLVRQKLNSLGAKGKPKSELYHLANDPTEADDVAAKHPDVVARLEKILIEQHTPSSVFPFNVLDRK
ncbi:arylsulfatase [Tuwongella immobilis]|uniref:Sulfatase N-terminal domain-containing protein n=1 Tax=Tuwongella immobilis TaxID=692036 RepID=A0A6C2YPS5_9BACT|nr:arylsulfatase [Tuwongella immobilis]VIP03630.1 sulfatase : Sulfatase OS=Pedosphaera parvula (strain Ellin514) GN=Cflav_PD0696 PE=4 SV=1: Sulfatase [Tuwongella immobilis]VTS04628.1 sulfatase : Sulfatase OS=Pedosphaera parvula (strain Ellin514) GN=Cflav_PD0696 PE=4 SV=1: Sulfatase [Tuwongella immobilis]